jgi:hypothetical protein
MGNIESAPAHRAQRRKTIALVLSGIFPGLGQFYNRQPIKAVVFIVAGVVLSWLWARAASPDPLALMRPDATTLVVLCVLLAVWVWSLVDAWRAG